jgi:hypothetical protein
MAENQTTLNKDAIVEAAKEILRVMREFQIPEGPPRDWDGTPGLTLGGLGLSQLALRRMACAAVSAYLGFGDRDK